MRIALLFVICSTVGLTQDTPPVFTPRPPLIVPAPAPFQPTIYIGGGGEYNNAGGGFAGETEVGVRIGTTPVYSYTTLEFAPKFGTIRTGTAFVAFQRGNLAVLTLADAGLSMGSSTLGSFSGGGMVMYDVGNRLNLGHFYIGLGGRLVATTSMGTQPVAVLTFGKGI